MTTFADSAAAPSQRKVDSVAFFVGGWIAQFVGNKMEGRKPSFFEDSQCLWVGPTSVLDKLFQKIWVRW